jgi:predicted transcriptional regulator
MKIFKESQGKNYMLSTKEIFIKDIPNLNNEITQKILQSLQKEPQYPKQLAKNLKIHEQNIYYYIKKLEKASIIKPIKQENINGTIANYYSISSNSFFFKFKQFEEASNITQKESNYLKPFIEKGRLNSLIIVGSPDPHGPLKARSRDGYFGMDLALFLGSFLNYIPDSKVRLDTEISKEELENNNLIVIGGPIVNKISTQINKKMPIYFDETTKGIYSKISKKTYFNDEIGMINRIQSPYNKDKKILHIAGIRNSGTKATILAFLKHFSKIKTNNIYNNKIQSKIVEGIDLDSDNQVDEVEFLE